MKMESLKPGQVVWDVVRHAMGNTTMRTVSVYAVKIIEVDVDGGFVVAQWHWNQPKKFGRMTVKKWRLNKPELVGSVAGSCRLKRRGE